MGLSQTLKFILGHPMNRGRPVATLARFAKWQLMSRLRDEVMFEWFNGARLVVRNGMTGATGNVYCGLHEYADMAFVLHLLRDEDLFLDLGANIGSYTVLASRVCGARSITIEPDPGTLIALRRNVAVNGIKDRVEIIETALGASHGVCRFSIGLDTTNRILGGGQEAGRNVRLTPLDDIVGNRTPTMIKMDVEGYEAEVLKGAQKTLQKASLVAVETETSDAEVIHALTKAGFEPWYYDPVSRELSGEPQNILTSNALFIRDIAHVRRRLIEAPVRKILGKEI